MKLQDILKEHGKDDLNYRLFRRNFDVYASTKGSDEPDLDEIFDFNMMIVQPDVIEIALQPISHDSKFSWPFHSVPENNLTLLFQQYHSNESATVTFKSLEECPNVSKIAIRCTSGFESLKGIEKLTNLKSFEFRLNKTEFEGGLLRFLKAPALTEIDVRGNPTNPEAVELHKAIDIINKHLKDKDIGECQQELIEAGYKKWAKL